MLQFIFGMLFGMVLGIIPGMIIVILAINSGGINDYYHIPFRINERDLYSIQDGQLVRIMTLPKKEELEKIHEID